MPRVQHRRDGWPPPVIEVAVEVDYDGELEAHHLAARPQVTLAMVQRIVDSGVRTSAMDAVIGESLLQYDGPPSSWQRWADLLADEDVTIAPSVAHRLAVHLVEQAATGRPFVEVTALAAQVSGPTDLAAYLRGRLILAGLDEHSPIAPVLDVLMTCIPDTPAKELGEWRERFDQARLRPAVAAPAAAPTASGEPDRATWGLLPSQVAQTNRLMAAAGAPAT